MIILDVVERRYKDDSRDILSILLYSCMDNNTYDKSHKWKQTIIQKKKESKRKIGWANFGLDV